MKREVCSKKIMSKKGELSYLFHFGKAIGHPLEEGRTP
jgi:hypothetical protein